MYRRSSFIFSVLFVLMGQLSISQVNKSERFWSPNSNGDNKNGASTNVVNFKIVDSETEKILSVKDDQLSIVIESEHAIYEFETKFDGRSTVTNLAGGTQIVKDVIHNNTIFYVYESTPEITITITRPGYKIYKTTIASRYSKFNTSREEVIYFPSELKINKAS
jgi:hypothetical protein